MRKSCGFFGIMIAMIVFSALLQAAETEEDIFGGDNIGKVIAMAEAGDDEAQIALAQRYRFGVDVPKDSAKAVEWFQKAAEQGNVQAQFSVGYMYAAGENGFERNLTKAAEWYRKAAEGGHANAQANLGNMYMVGAKDLPMALYWFQQAVDQGNAIAQNAMAGMYANGNGVPRDQQKAITLYQKAADQGYPSAQYELGLIYSAGKGVKKDQEAAFQWIRKAAHQRNTMAQRDLGHLYRNGRGVKKDEIEGMAWIYLADNARPVGFPNPEINLLEQKLGKKKITAARQRSDELQQIINSEFPTRTTGIISEPIEKPTGSGAGAVISQTGLILTAAHIVAEANSVKIGLPASNQLLDAKILEIDKKRDLAILKCEGSITPLTVTSSEHIHVGQSANGVLTQRPVDGGRNPSGAFSRLYIQKLTAGKKKPEYMQAYAALVSVSGPQPNSAASGKILKDIAVRFLSDASGPLLDEAGNLIGMIPEQTPNADGSINILKSEAMRPLLEKYGVKIIDSPSNENIGTSDGNFNAPPIMKPNRTIVMILTY